MKAKDKNKNYKADKWKFSFTPILRYNLFFCILILMMILIGGAFICINIMTDGTNAALAETKPRMEYRIEQSKNLLSSLAAMDRYSDPDVPIKEKVIDLERMNEYFGYMMICYVDEDMNVWDKDGPASLTSRDYMQKLFYTGETQITDSFEAGADGVTLNYTIAVPIISDSKVVGSIFCAIYFDEMVEILNLPAGTLGANGTLIGSRNQIMSSTNGLGYGNSYIDELRNYKLFGTNAGIVDSNFFNHVSDNYWSMKGANLYYTSYAPIEGTNWKVVSSVGLWETFMTVLPSILIMMLLCAILFAGLMLITRRYVRSQLKTVDLLVQSVQELERRIYQDSRPDDVNLDDIINLTSTGLSDGLTGVVTRTVFLNQFKGLLGKQNPDKILALCFVDLDDLKKLNDNYGHDAGDIGLKSIGYVLREYEKKYDGLVGRYGGDEFILVLTDIDNEQELKEVLDELALRLHSTIMQGEVRINIKCSVGVSIWNRKDDTNTIIKQADEALYFVKQNGKGYYKIYQDKL